MSKTSSKTKAQLLEENALLKGKLKEMLGKAKKAQEAGDMEDIALGVTKVDGRYKLVELRYNPISKEAKVVEVRPAGKNDNDYSIAMYNAKVFLVENIMEQINSKGEKK